MTNQVKLDPARNSIELRYGLTGPARRDATPAALLIGSEPEDEAFLQGIFDLYGWDLYVVRNLGAALTLLRLIQVPVVITERDLAAGGWKDVLQEVRDLGHQPLLVVTSRLADEYLWSEVLNWGGHDVLAKPLRQPEVVWVLNHAWRTRGIEAGNRG